MYKVLFSMTSILCTILFSCKQKQAPPALPTPVNLYAVSMQPVLYYDRYPSTVQALSQVNIVPEVQGYITGIFFKEGDRVKKGQKLYEIDKRLYSAAVDGAAANVKVAQGNEEQARQDADRYVYLNNYHAVAKQQYDHAVIAYKNAKNQVKAAEEAVRTAKTNLAYTTIYAPFDGTIGFSQVKTGNMVSVGSTILNTISTNDPMAVDFVINVNRFSLFDLSTIEAMEAGKPLLLHSIGGNRAFERLGAGCVMLRDLEPATIGAGLAHLSSLQQSMLLSLGRQSRECWERHLTPRLMWERHLALYDMTGARR